MQSLTLDVLGTSELLVIRFRNSFIITDSPLPVSKGVSCYRMSFLNAENADEPKLGTLRLVEESSEMAEVAAGDPFINQAWNPKVKGSKWFPVPKSSTSFCQNCTHFLPQASIVFLIRIGPLRI